MDIEDLEDGEPSLFASVGVLVKRRNGDLFPYNIVVHRNLDDLLETALDVGYNRRLWANGEFWSRTGGGAHGMHCARVPCVEAAGVKIAQLSRHLAARVE